MSRHRKLYQAEDLLLLTTKLFVGRGLRHEVAQVIAEDLVTANLRGVDSHSMYRRSCLDSVKKAFVFYMTVI